MRHFHNFPAAQFPIKFAITGALGTVVNLSLMALLVEQMTLPPVTASVIATEISIVHNFILNSLWTFSSRNPRNSLSDRFFRFHCIALLGLIVNVAIVFLLVRIGIWYLAAQAIGIFCAWLVNYWAANRLVFMDVTSTKAVPRLASAKEHVLERGCGREK